MQNLSPTSLPAYLEDGPKQLLIDGDWVESSTGETIETPNPSTGQPLARFAAGDAADVDRAVAAARRALEGEWSRIKPAARQRLILRLAELVDEHRDELRLLDTFDLGRPVSRTSPSPEGDVLRYYAGMTTQIYGRTITPSSPGEFLTYTLREPIGVVGAIIPWNAPVASSLWKIGPVLATGCTMVLKPAEQASLSVLRLGELVREAGIPAGVVNIITGTGTQAGAALTTHPDVDKIAFTGSTTTARAIVAAGLGNMKRFTLELGGKSANILFADADLDAAVPMAAMAAFFNSGQICMAGSRLFVERPIYDEVVERVSSFANSLKVGDSLDEATQVGPLVSAAQLARVNSYLDIASQEGAQMTAGGSAAQMQGLSGGYFVAPTVLADVQDEMRVAKEEIFGPVLSVLPFDDTDEVVARANASEFGLAGGVWTQDIARAHRVAHGVRTGTMWVNCFLAVDPAVPFGGYKESGWGREQGTEFIDEYTETKAVWVRL